MIRRGGRARSRPRPDRHGRHGRIGRSAVVRPPLPPLETRYDRFELTVGSAVEFLRAAWPELREVRVEIDAMPARSDADGIPRWSVDTAAGRIVLHRLPIERLAPVHADDDLHRRILIESAVFRAAAEYLGKDPWELGADRYRPY